jgi:hypothetical protein
MSTQEQHTALFLSIKNQALLRVAVLYYNFLYGAETGPLKAVKERLRSKGMPYYNSNIVYELTPADVAPLIHCSKRKAKEYIDLLRILIK